MVDPNAAGDSTIIAALVSSPAWMPWLQDVNLALTTLTLITGLAFGLARFIAFLRDRRRGDRR